MCYVYGVYPTPYVSSSILAHIADMDLSQLSLSELGTNLIDAVLETIKDEQVSKEFGIGAAVVVVAVIGAVGLTACRCTSFFYVYLFSCCCWCCCWWWLRHEYNSRDGFVYFAGRFRKRTERERERDRGVTSSG